MHNPPLARCPLSSPSSLNVPFTSCSHGSLHPPQGGCPSTALSSDGWFLLFFFFLLQFLYHCQEVGRWYPSCSLLLLPKHSSSLLSKTCNFESYLIRLFHPLLFKIEVQLIYNVVLSFRCTESDSVTYMYIYIFFHILLHHRLLKILNIVPCAVSPISFKCYFHVQTSRSLCTFPDNFSS